MKRSTSLKRLGYDSYQEYLDGDLWKIIRKKAFRRAKGACRLCGDTAEVVHHRFYTVTTLAGQNPSGLVALCHGCHEHIEFRGLKKLRTHLVRRRYIKMLRLSGNNRSEYVAKRDEHLRFRRQNAPPESRGVGKSKSDAIS